MLRRGATSLLLAVGLISIAWVRFYRKRQQSRLEGRHGAQQSNSVEEEVSTKPTEALPHALPPPPEPLGAELIDALAAMGGPFDTSDLGGGLWLALHSRGPVPKWQKNQELLKVFGVRNRAGQTYFPRDKRVENYGEVVGGLVTFGAEGTFALPAGPLRAPCDLPVEIAAGGLTVFGKRFELPIAGPGLVRVLYHDSTMRIFESPLTSQDKWEESGLVVVQVRESAVINS